MKEKIVSLETRTKMSKSKSGRDNYYFGKKLHPNTILAAHKARGKEVYVYSEENKDFIGCFVSIKETAKRFPVNPGTLIKKLDTNHPFKGFYYYSYPLNKN